MDFEILGICEGNEYFCYCGIKLDIIFYGDVIDYYGQTDESGNVYKIALTECNCICSKCGKKYKGYYEIPV